MPNFSTQPNPLPIQLIGDTQPPLLRIKEPVGHAGPSQLLGLWRPPSTLQEEDYLTSQSKNLLTVRFPMEMVVVREVGWWRLSNMWSTTVSHRLWLTLTSHEINLVRNVLDISESPHMKTSQLVTASVLNKLPLKDLCLSASMLLISNSTVFLSIKHIGGGVFDNCEKNANHGVTLVGFND